MSKPAVETHGLRKAFGGVQALDGLSLAVPAGSVLGLLGPNGSGKTTTVSILATSLRPDAGRATVGGLDVVTEAAQVRRVIGLAGQFAAVDPNLTGRENLRLIGRLSRVGRRQARVRADELLDSFGLNAAADRFVRGYSGGMRRRLDVAAALLHRPAVLFLDEPTTGLDPESRFALWDSVRDLARSGTTVLLTTQYLEEALLGLPVNPPVAHFTPVTLANGVSLDFDHYDHVDEHHYAFQLSDEEFEAAFGRIRDRGIAYYADPACRQPGQVYASKNGRRGTYFRDPDGHLMEILTPVKGETA